MAQTVESAETIEPILSTEEAYAVFDRQVQRLMHGMSGEEFLRRWNAGEYADDADKPGNRHIIRLAMMIPGGQQSS
jgi:hypothetical protein